METTSEIDGTHRLPIYARSLENELQKVIHDVGKRRIVNEIQPDYAYSYACRFIQRVNKEEEKSEKKTSKRGMIKVSGLSHKRAKQSYPRLAWFMFQNIY